jgi:hypothetical protein
MLVNERLEVASLPRQPLRVAVVAALIGLPLVVVAPAFTVLLLVVCALAASLMFVWNSSRATVFLAASFGLVIPVLLYLGLAVFR